jgi:beta-phosphoglucomutase-like phosphatase (HAD superfamily)
VLPLHELDLGRVTTLLCDADGTLFPSEEPAFEASATVVNRAMADLGAEVRFTGTQLRHAATGRNFHGILGDLAVQHRLELTDSVLQAWVEEEVDVVTAHLRTTLRPDPHVRDPLHLLSARFDLAVVSSSALRRLAACFAATDLDSLFAEDVRFSAQDSLPMATSKPDPAVYAFAAEALGVCSTEALAIEDAASGVVSARAAGIQVVGTVMFVPPEERTSRAADLMAAGAAAVLESWDDLVAVLSAVPGRTEQVAAR